MSQPRTPIAKGNTMNITRSRIVPIVAAVVAALLAGSLLAPSQASAGDGHSRGGEKDPADLAAACFAEGIDDLISDFDAALQLWEGCFTDDYSFEAVFFPGGPSFVCPSPDCPIQEFSSRAEIKAQFAAVEFARAGYLATQHQMLNVTVDRHGHRTATVSANIQANHFLPNNSVDIFWGDYTIEVVNEGGRWKVQKETIVGTSFLNFVGAPAPS